MMLPAFSLIRREYLRWIRAPTWVISGLMSPILYLLLFGQAFDLGKLLPARNARECPVEYPVRGSQLLLLLRSGNGGFCERNGRNVLRNGDHLR